MIEQCKVLCTNTKQEDLGLGDADLWLDFVFDWRDVKSIKEAAGPDEEKLHGLTTIYVNYPSEAFVINVAWEEAVSKYLECKSNSLRQVSV